MRTQPVVPALVVPVAVGLVFGKCPAVRACRLDPVLAPHDDWGTGGFAGGSRV